MNVIYFNEESKEFANQQAKADKISNAIEKVAIFSCAAVSVFAIAILMFVLL